jgi:hypothetical protein
MLVKDMAKDETLTIMKPVLPSANLGPEEFYKVEIKTFSGMTKNFVADRPQGKVHENANQINGNAVTPPKPHLVLVK